MILSNFRVGTLDLIMAKFKVDDIKNGASYSIHVSSFSFRCSVLPVPSGDTVTMVEIFN